MKNNLNEKNNSISNYTNNIVLDNINIIPSRITIKSNNISISDTKHNKKSKKNNKESKKYNKESKKYNKESKKYNKEEKKKIVTQKRNLFISNKQSEFPQGEIYKCIGPCYPAETLYYHPLTLQAIKNNHSSCPIKLSKSTNKITDNCKFNENFDFENYDIFADIFQIASNDNDFLKQIYNIKNINDVEIFLENNILQLPILSQIRLCNSIFKVYRDNDAFPNNNFIEYIKNIIESKYNLKLKSEKIINKIMSVKHSKNNEDLIEILIK